MGLTEAKLRNLAIGESRQVPVHGEFAGVDRRAARGIHQGCVGCEVWRDPVHIIGPQATELISEAVAAMELEATVADLMWTIHGHPTLAEAILDASK